MNNNIKSHQSLKSTCLKIGKRHFIRAVLKKGNSNRKKTENETQDAIHKGCLCLAVEELTKCWNSALMNVFTCIIKSASWAPHFQSSRLYTDIGLQCWCSSWVIGCKIFSAWVTLLFLWVFQRSMLHTASHWIEDDVWERAVTLRHNKCHMITFCKCQVMYLHVYSAVPRVPKSQESL